MKLNQRGAVMIAVLAVAFILNVMLLAFFFTSRQSSKVSGKRKLDMAALNIAEGGKEHLYAEVINNICIPIKDSTVQYFNKQPFKKGYYSVAYTAKRWADTLWIVSEGYEDNTHSTLDVIAKVSPYLSINNPPVRGAITAHSIVHMTGNILVDGRDHDTLCNLTGDPGVYAVSTCDTFDLSGNAKVAGKGYDPVKKNKFEPYRTLITEEHKDTSGKFSSPEAFLGLPAGSLDGFKSGDPTIPQDFRALIYKTVDVGPVHFGDNAAGILIVHNATKTAQLSMNAGEFKGLIIADDIRKISGNVVIHGAIVALKDSTVVVDGVGTGKVCYSSEILQHLSSYCNNFRKSIDEVSWKERVE